MSAPTPPRSRPWRWAFVALATTVAVLAVTLFTVQQERIARGADRYDALFEVYQDLTLRCLATESCRIPADPAPGPAILPERAATRSPRTAHPKEPRDPQRQDPRPHPHLRALRDRRRIRVGSDDRDGH